MSIFSFSPSSFTLYLTIWLYFYFFQSLSLSLFQSLSIFLSFFSLFQFLISIRLSVKQQSFKSRTLHDSFSHFLTLSHTFLSVRFCFLKIFRKFVRARQRRRRRRLKWHDSDFDDPLPRASQTFLHSLHSRHTVQRLLTHSLTFVNISF